MGRLYCPIRCLPALMLLLAGVISFLLRANINIAIIEMTRNATSLCRSKNYSVTIDSVQRHILCWTETEQSLVKGSFFYGYLLVQIPSGRLCEVYGTRRVLGLATLACSLLTLVTPWLALRSLWGLHVARALVGLFAGGYYPSICPMLIKWCGENELSGYTALAVMGGTCGHLLIFPICGLVMEHLGWENLFYFCSLCTGTWCLVWFLIITDGPEDHPLISEEEKKHILSTRMKTSPNQHREKVPWCAIITSPAVLATGVAIVGFDYGALLIDLEGPNFLDSVLKLNIAMTGLLSGLPYLGRFIMGLLAGWAADLLIARPHLISKLNVRKYFMTVAFLSPAVCLVAMTYYTDNTLACVAWLITAQTLNGLFLSFYSNITDIAPSLSGTVFGLINVPAASTGLIATMVTNLFTAHDPSNPAGWRLVFLSVMVVYVSSVLFYCMFGQAKRQPFDQEPERLGREI